jgi:hypothetical protein
MGKKFPHDSAGFLNNVQYFPLDSTKKHSNIHSEESWWWKYFTIGWWLGRWLGVSKANGIHNFNFPSK